MFKTKADFTMTFRALSELSLSELNDSDVIRKHWALYDLSKDKNWKEWLDHYRKRLLEYVKIVYS